MIFSVLVDEWGGGHLVKGDEKEEEVPSSLGEAQADRAVRENQLDENQMFETKEEMRGDGELIQKEKLRKRGAEDGKSKKRPGKPKPIADVIGAKKNKNKRIGKHAKKGKGKDAKKTKKQKKTRPKKKSKSQTCDNKCTVQEKKISSSGRNSRDTECCNDKWAAYTSLIIGLAPNVIKQVGNFFFFKS